eukprot:scaffold5476_cov43-Prasinocladus_malaysianus.AAC.1
MGHDVRVLLSCSLGLRCGFKCSKEFEDTIRVHGVLSKMSTVYARCHCRTVTDGGLTPNVVVDWCSGRG